LHYIEKLRNKLEGKLIQTHASWVIVTDEVVYKIKKPVNFGFLDYSTLEKRKYFCEKEIVLNRRLCPYIYLGVVPISLINDEWHLEDDTNIVEYAVKMRRIKEENLLSNMLEEGSIKREHIIKIAETVAHFHLSAEKAPDYGKKEIMRFNTDENFEQVKPFVGETIGKEDFELIKRKTEYFYRKYDHLFKKRIVEGKIVDGHGDIRLEHIAFLEDCICIFDCIEFNDRFRCGDMVNDMCFLSVELDFRGREDLSNLYESCYVNITKDEDFYSVLPFFKSYRAFVRGKVYSFLSKDKFADGDTKKRAKDTALRFFKLSKKYAENIS